MPSFNKKKTTKKTTPKRSRWAGVNSRDDGGQGTPILTEGTYTLKLKDLGELKNDSGRETAIIPFEVVESEGKNAMEPGNEGVFLTCVDDKWNYGAARVKAFVMAMIGCPDDDSYDEFDEEGYLIDQFLGEENDFDGDTAADYVGKTIEVVVRRGNDVTKDGEPTGDYYRDFDWTTNGGDD